MGCPELEFIFGGEIVAGIYIHVPFCQSKCHYCDFASWSGKEKMIPVYFERLKQEIRQFGAHYDRETVDTIYFGGGTPSVVEAAEIEGVLEEIDRQFALSDPECTLEMNPASADLEKMRQYRAMGINRVSVGLQAKQDELLKTLGRIHSWQDFCQTMEALKTAGIRNVSADLMFGLPGQTCEMLEASATALATFEEIRHISCYSLKIEEGTPFERMQVSGKLALPDEDEERKMQHGIIRQLEGLGFKQYEISNFAIPGFESRHNSCYWDLSDYIGFGLGASSYYRGCRYTNTFDLMTYIETPFCEDIPKEESHQLSVEEQKGDFMFLGLRRMAGVKDEDYRRLFHQSFFDDYKEAIPQLEKQGLIQVEGDRIFLSPRGQDFANQVFMAFV